MKKQQIITTAAIASMAFLAGATFNDFMVDNIGLREANTFNKKVIHAQNEALNKAEEVMDNNDLYDTDGSDTMADYMEAYNKVQALYAK